MIITVIILGIIALFIIMLFTISLKARFIFDTEESNMYMTLFWLPPLFKAVLEIVNTAPVLTIIILNKELLSKTLRSKKKSLNTQLIKQVNPQELVINAYYGFRDPFSTGVATGFLGAISNLTDIASVRHWPDFTAIRDYIYVDASARINVGTALLSYLRS
ncbi:hypothetical protein [Pseudobacteroides cellulosolvens]|uniref:Uncharacterized protein n=1 Tax=Pseudobacteroides cellulosolvens ATCC 35603 = DSM 2933 TaxID=398512 RepID=A0A0L6JNW5_9FIRM|nr:hypothetical protein [Pseudobacteroides cellulosolvens]KNY27531.1 hypothetical protein Bccel_2802 [Pseudobacteroides cellulosolvens ATCC 35603 = DSM 2933]